MPSAELGIIATARDEASSTLGHIVNILGRIGLAAMGVNALIDAAKGLGSTLGIGLSSELEQTRARFMAFTKDAEVTAQILGLVRAEADKTPFSFQAMSAATAGLIPAAKQANEPLMDLLKTAEILAASNPAQGLEGAAFSLREAVSGDFVSIIERFNLPRSYINKLKEEGVPALEAVRKAMLAMGYDSSLVANMSQTLEGRWSTLMDTIDGIRMRVSQPIFDALKAGLVDLQNWFDSNKAQIDQWTAQVSGGISAVIWAVGELAPSFATALGDTLGVVMSIGQMIYEALSYLNPFATHSPSLVSQVDDGINRIIAKYGELPVITGPVMAAANSLKSLGFASQSGMQQYISSMEATQNKALLIFGVEVPAAFFTAQAAVQSLEGELFNLQSAMAAHQSVVDGIRADMEGLAEKISDAQWAEQDLGDSFASTTNNLQPFQDAVKSAQEQVTGLQDQLNSAKQAIQDFANTPIEGTKEYTDKIAALNDEIAKQELALLRVQRAGGSKTDQAVIQKRIDDLKQQAAILGKEEEVKFNPKRRQIEALANPTKELSFDAITKGIRDAQAKIPVLEPKLNQAQLDLKAAQRALDDMSGAFGGASGAARGHNDAIRAMQLEYRELEKKLREAQKPLAADQDAYDAAKAMYDRYMADLNDFMSKAEAAKAKAEADAKAAAKAAVGALGDGKLKLPKIEVTDFASFDVNSFNSLESKVDQWKTKIETEWKPSIDKFRESIDGWSASMRDAGSLLDTILGKKPPKGDQPTDFASFDVNDAANASDKLGERIVKMHNDAVVKYGPKAIGMMAAFGGEVIGGLLGGIGSAIGNLGGVLGENISRFLDEALKAVQPKGAAATKAMTDGMAKAFIDWFNGDGPVILAQGFLDLVGGILGFIGSTAGHILGGLGAWTGAFLGWQGELWGNLLGGMGEFFESLYNWVSDRGVDLRRQLDKWVNSFTDWVGDVWDGGPGAEGKGGVKGGLADLIKQMGDWVEKTGVPDAIRQGISFGEAIINGIREGLRNVTIPLPKFKLDLDPRNGMPSIGFLLDWKRLGDMFPALAEGGIVTRPTFALIGERGPEAVIPLSGRGQGMAPVVYNITVQVYGSVTAERDLANSIRRELIKTGQRNAYMGAI